MVPGHTALSGPTIYGAIATRCATGALMFGGAGIANAASIDSPVPASTTTLAQTEDADDRDNTGLWDLRVCSACWVCLSEATQ